MVSALRLGGADTPAHGGRRLVAEVRFTGRVEGDMADPSGVDPVVTQRRQAVVRRPWTWLHQVHGATVAEVAWPGGAAGATADAAVSVATDAASGVALAVLVADCAPVALASPEGVIGVAHAGWRGLLAGVIEATVAAMRGLGAGRVVAALGPCIHAECYQFGSAQLDELATRFGPEVRGRSRDGALAFDIPAAVRAALARSDTELVWDADTCTACSEDHWSWRARRERQRQAVVVWRP
jgi:YfiH family protein